MKNPPKNESKLIDKFCKDIKSNWNFGPMRSHHLHCVPFTLTNPSSTLPLAIAFSDCIFHFDPPELLLRCRETATVKIYFFFCEAKIIVGKVEMRVNDKLRKIIKLSAIGKIPFLKLSRTQIDFGELNLFKQRTERLQIKNLSEVAVDFRLKRKTSSQSESAPAQSSTVDSKRVAEKAHIRVSPLKGFLRPGEMFQLTVKYSPTIFDKHDYEEYLVEAEEKTLTGNEGTIRSMCVERWNRVSAKRKLQETKKADQFEQSSSKEYFYDIDAMHVENSKEAELTMQGGPFR